MDSVRAEVSRLSFIFYLHEDVYLTWLRGYHLKKIQENNESEIMQTVLEEARESYASEIVVELQSETTGDLESNVNRIAAWVEAWLKNQSNTST